MKNTCDNVQQVARYATKQNKAETVSQTNWT